MTEPSADAPSAGRLEGREHVLAVRVYYEDTDLSGLVYHARYLHFFERGRSDFLRHAGIAHAALLERDDPMVFAVRRMSIEFAAPARIDDALEVRSRFREIRGARIFVDQEIRRGDARLASAEVEIASISPDGRPRRPPRELLDALKPLLEEGGKAVGN